MNFKALSRIADIFSAKSQTDTFTVEMKQLCVYNHLFSKLNKKKCPMINSYDSQIFIQSEVMLGNA